MTYRIPVTITDVFERKVQKHTSGFGDNTMFETSSAGWYLRLNDHLSIYVGMEKPELAAGDKMVMKLERSLHNE